MADNRGSGPRTGGKGGSRNSKGPSGRGGQQGDRGGARSRSGEPGRGSGGRDDRGRRDAPIERGRGGHPKRISSKKSDRAEWGSLTRKGASYIDGRVEPSGLSRPDPEPEAIDPRIRSEAKHAIDRAASKTSRKRRRSERTTLPKVPLSLDDPEKRLVKALGKDDGAKARAKLEKVSLLFADGRLVDAQKGLRPLAEAAPDVAEIRELYGLTFYRLGKWKRAIVELEAFRELAGTAEQHPVLADCYRALEKWADVDELWDELREQSPNAALVTEGRIVVAGSKADRGDLQGAIALLEQGWKQPKRARDHHLSRAYALADLYEQAGKTARARELFGWLNRQDGDYADVASRVNALS